MRACNFLIQKIYPLQPRSNPQPQYYKAGALSLSHRSRLTRVSFPGNNKISALFVFPGITLHSRDFSGIAGTKICWNSLLAMLERILEIKSAFLKALTDIKAEQMMGNVEFETVITIVACLKSVKISLEKLCSRNGTLLTSEGVFSFANGELNE
ncbi:uncharacterized protein TNCV_627751 [Trichonephila clavipes]|nr:uncharacterized protein TNCV_627751 [Trichonephila clavipes]